MTSTTPKFDPRLRNRMEQSVIEALSRLPPGYSINLEPGGILFEVGEERRKFYPDIEVVAPTGTRLLVEIVSRHALSIANMAHLYLITKQIQKEKAGAAFVLLVPDAAPGQPYPDLFGEFRELPLVLISHPSEIVPAVLDALSHAVA